MWIYVPSRCCPSAAVPGDSISDSHWRSQMLASSATSRSKPLPVRSWQRAWKKESWIRLLYGRIYEPSMAAHGVARWIASLQATRASHSASPEKCSEKKTHAISGRKSHASSARLSQLFASSRMSADIYDWGLSKSTMTYPRWVTQLRRACLQRKKSVLRISANGCLFWPTVTVTDASVTHARPPEKMVRKDGRNVLRMPSLAETVLQPSDFPYTKQDLQRQTMGEDYALRKRFWLTPRAQESSRESQESFLRRNADRTDACHGSLNQQACQWNTPTARDWKDGAANYNSPTKSQLGRQAPRMMKVGDPSQITLNPRFTEWLMGWPIGWTAFAPVATEWCHWLPHMRGALYALTSRGLVPI